MSLDLTLTAVKRCEIYRDQITHNLIRIAEDVGIYMHLWHPEEIGVTKARQLVEPLQSALALLRAEPARFERHNAPERSGPLTHFGRVVENYLRACQQNPDADVCVTL